MPYHKWFWSYLSELLHVYPPSRTLRSSFDSPRTTAGSVRTENPAIQTQDSSVWLSHFLSQSVSLWTPHLELTLPQDPLDTGRSQPCQSIFKAAETENFPLLTVCSPLSNISQY